MTTDTNAPVHPHRRATIHRPIAYSANMDKPFRIPRPIVLRAADGHVIGLGIAGHRQSYIRWGRCPDGLCGASFISGTACGMPEGHDGWHRAAINGGTMSWSW
jgi:hypothetical protein